jgi:transposase
MARPAMFKAPEKERIVLPVLRGEARIAEPARHNRCSETSSARWRYQFCNGGAPASEAGASRGPAVCHSQLERQLDQVTGALGDAHV